MNMPSTYRKRKHDENRAKHIARQRKHYHEGGGKRYYRDYSLRRKYGISADDYDRMLADQDGSCAICKQPPPEDKILFVDHDHSTGEVRGLLCQHCNSAIGFLKEQPEILASCIEYLKRGN